MALSRGVFVVFLLAALTPAVPAVAAPVLRGAEVLVEFQSPTACVVTLTVNVEGADAGGAPRGSGGWRSHRVERDPRCRADWRCSGGRADARAGGAAGGRRYSLRYAVEQPRSSAGRCPLWIPTVPAEGRSQAVALRVRIPAGATAAGTMPWLAWVGQEGSATLGHLPAFVRVPYAMPGEPAPLDIAFAMDVVAIADAGPGLLPPGPGARAVGAWHDRAENDAVPATCARNEAKRRRSVPDPGFGWSFYGFFVAAAGVARALFPVGVARGTARPAAEPPMVADSGVLLWVTLAYFARGVRRVGVGLPPRHLRGGVPGRRPDHRPVGGRRRAGGDADQRRHVRRHAGPPLPDRRELDVDLVRRLGRLG